jgi:hypothetical protein
VTRRKIRPAVIGAVIALGLALFLVASCDRFFATFFDGEDATDIETIEGHGLFVDIPASARQLHDNYMTFQSDREFLSFRDTKANVDRFVARNSKDLVLQKWGHFPHYKAVWWVRDQKQLGRIMHFQKGCTFLDIGIEDDAGGSTIWALEEAGC